MQLSFQIICSTRLFNHKHCQNNYNSKKFFKKVSLSQLNCCLQSYKHKLQDGAQLEVLKYAKSVDESKPPLIFLHGTSHAAWCYGENFLPYFGELGYPSYALSFRGQGESDPVDGPVAGTVQLHTNDVVDFVKKLKSEYGEKKAPVILAHSFGGYIAQLYVQNMEKEGYPQITGVGCLCSVPPSGNAEMIQRFLKKDFWLSVKITWAFIRKTYAKNKEDCKFTFFSGDLDDALLQRYYEKIGESVNWVRLIDLNDFRKRPTLSKPDRLPPALVLGAAQDKLVDDEGVKETAEWLDVEPIVIDNMSHDCMLDTRWERVAESVLQWLQEIQ
eukprot:TRINITY_DN19101_c0_g1_i1.p1 TRINITY_DN19101_c0_g1~~TRINITY_DN19101_c0_g1_i1.p1  ORF type:complete len:329 (-),score=39.91 TRINITY_DN19101_c0_g1_i1:364-1350(-)